jgi:uncharacterized protein (TIGR02099 family)
MLMRIATVVSVVAAVVIAFTIIALRYWVLPDIGQYHDGIVASLAGTIGSPVTIGKIESDWQGIYPHLKFTNVHILDEQRQPALVLPRIDINVSWMSLLAAELRLASLEIDKPELFVRRDTQGRFFIGGVALSSSGGDDNLADWLLHQSRMVVRNALIVWVDEKRGARPLVLQQVELRIENLFSHHRFALRALPTERLSTPLDVRGDFSGTSFADLKQWRGKLYTQLDYTDVTAWRPWMDLPGEFSRGHGALRGWLDIEGGKVTGVAADVALYDVATKLAEDVPEMLALSLRGRAEWHDVAGGLEISTRQLSMRLQNGVELQPTDFYFLTAKASNLLPAYGALRANLLQLDSLVGLAEFLPMEARLRERLGAYGPRGRVSNLNVQWQGEISSPDSYQIKGHFEGLAVNQVGKMPGFSGLTADVDSNEEGGRLTINARQLIVDAPGMMREPLTFTTLTGQAGWKYNGQEWSINVNNVAIVNDDLAGNLFGSYETKAGTLGVLDLTGRLTRGNIRSAARYTPLVALNREGNDWLNGALLAGHTEDFRIRIKGNLSDFPLHGTEDVIFKIGGHAKDVVLEFDKRWPRIENISGEFLINGNKLKVQSPSANMAGADLHKVTVVLPDMMSRDLVLEINGEATATSNVFLKFIQQSPVRGYIDGMTDGMHASGNGHLDLSLRVPISGDQSVKVLGTVRVQDNDIDIGGGVPLLRKTRGTLSFTESGMKTSGVQTEVLGGAATINVQSAEGGVMHASLKGYSNLDGFRNSNPYPVLNYLHGSAAWDADIRVAKKSAQVIFKSDLRGISSSLPQPFTKPANEAMPLRFERSNVANGQDVITAQLGELLSLRLARRDEEGTMVIKRGVIKFGKQDNAGDKSKLPDKDGLWLTGTVPELSIQGWEGLVGNEDKSEPPLPIAGGNLLIEQLTGYGLIVKGVRIKADRRANGFVAQLTGSMANGEVVWQPHAASTGSGLGYDKNGKVSAHFRNLQLDNAQPASPASLVQGAIPGLIDKIEPLNSARQKSMLAPGNLAALEIMIENLQLKGKHVGRFELVGYPEGQDWLLRRLRFTNPDGSLMGDGIWRGNGQSQINLMLDISDAGKILDRSGYPNTVKGGSGKLVADLSWAGAPHEFNYATLNGTFKLDSDKGRFLKMNPGAGKLLSILSLQALPKHITLDFTDVFSEGFQFDNINGNAIIKNGVLDTQDFHIDGSSAKVTLKGSVNMNDETQNMRVRVLPTVGDTVSLGVAFAAGPAIGVGTLLLNKVLGNPLDKLVSYEYNVSGTWTEPNVVKVGSTPDKAKENNPSE